MIIRRAWPKDVKEIHTLVISGSEQGKILPRSLTDIRQNFSDFFVALNESDEIIGCAAVAIYSPKLAEVRSLVVLPDYRGKGIGKKLVKACIKEAKKYGIYEVMAITDQPKFFEKCGLKHCLGGQYALFTRP